MITTSLKVWFKNNGAEFVTLWDMKQVFVTKKKNSKTIKIIFGDLIRYFL